MIMQAPAVSVIIPAHKAPHFVNQAVDSVLGQTFDDYEIIIVDDCSGPEYTAQYNIVDKVKLICQTQKTCASAVRNVGIRASKGKYLAFLDQDDIWLPNFLASQVCSLEENPQAGLVFCHYKAVDESLRPIGGETKPRKHIRSALNRLCRGCFIRTPSCILTRRDAVVECGMFDESIVGAGDWDFYLSMAKHRSFIARPDRLTLYRMHPDQMHKRTQTMRKATLRVMDKTLSWALEERPGLVNCVRRNYSRMLRKIAISKAGSEKDTQGARDTIRRAINMWPYSPQNYFALIGIWSS